MARAIAPCALAVLLAAGRALAAPGAAALLELENRRLENQMKLAESKEFYLRLDLDGRRLDLMLEGVVLRTHPVARVEIGRPTVAFAARPAPADWTERAWEAGRLEPPRPGERLEIRANEGGTDPPEVPEIPPTPEERIPAPERFEIRYDGGLTLEIAGTDAPGRGLLERAADALRSLVSFGDGDTRLRLLLDRQDVADLYRSIPEDSNLTVD
jgi:hypothetical protein